MKKKFAVTRKTKKPSRSVLKLHYVVIFFGLLVVVLTSAKLYQKPHVLGASIYLAQGGDDSTSGSSDNSSSGSHSNTDSGSNSGSGGGDTGGSTSQTLGSEGSGSGNTVSEHAISETTQVDCVGPDGKHFTTTFKGCYELNHAWNRSNFSFTPLNSTTSTNTTAPTNKTSDVPEHLQVKAEGHNMKVEINQEGTKVELQSEDSGVSAKAKHTDGTETSLESNDAIEKLNESLKNEDIEIGTDDPRGLTIKKGEVEAHAELPISVDPTTHALTITTPAGVKTVTVLPDEAVNNLLSHNIIDTVENIASGSSETTLQNVTLTSLNNEAVFAVNGTSSKKLLGIFPLHFAKQAFVSAESGKVVQVNETILSKFLETFSF